MMCSVFTLMQLLVTAYATVPHADARHSGPVDSESARLSEELKAAEQKVHENAAAARKAAHGDGSDSFANSLEKSMMALEKEDQENQERAKARHHQLEMERQVHKEIAEANKMAHARAAVMTPEAAAKEVEETAENIRKAAHGDGSDKFASEIEETVMDLEEMKHENEEKMKERRARHQHEHEVLEQRIHARREALANEHKKAATVLPQTQHGESSKHWANQLEETVLDLEHKKDGFEDKAQERRAQHALESQVRKEIFNAQQPLYSHTHRLWQLPVEKQQDSSNADVVQSGANVLVFLLFAALLGSLVWWKKFVNSNSRSVHVPVVGKVNAVQTERMVMGLLARASPNASLYVYQDDARASAPLKNPFAGPQAGYGVFTL
jgi:hypothetical protein